MNALKTGLLAVIALLMLLVVIDQARAPEQLKAVNDSLVGLSQTEQKQLEAVEAMRHELARMQLAPVAGSAAEDHGGTTAAAPAGGAGEDACQLPPTPTAPRDGNPKLGVNFLIPYDRSYSHPNWVRGTLRVLNDTTKSLNPITDNSATTQEVFDLVNDSLCGRTFCFPEQWSEDLADSVVISDDYKVYTFTIRKGVMWQRPSIAKQAKYSWLDKDVELTADDFKFYLDMVLDPKVDCPDLRAYYDDLASYEAVDRYTFKMAWKRKVYNSLAFSLGQVSPMPRHIFAFAEDGSPIPKNQIGIAFNKHWFVQARCAVGVGEYSLERYEPDVLARFVRNPSYFGATEHWDAIEWNLQIKQPDAKLTAFKNGQIHAYGLTPLQFKSEILDRKPDSRFAALDPGDPKAGRAGQLGWEKVVGSGFAMKSGESFSYLGWNMRHPPFDDIRVRQAMSYAFPKKRIIDQVFNGLGKPVLSDVSPDSQYYNRELEPYDFDLEKARAILDQAGWTVSADNPIRSKEINGKTVMLSATIKYLSNIPEWDNTLAIYANELKRIGVELKPMSMEWKSLMRVYEDKDFDAIVGGWLMGVDIDFFQLWHSSQADLQGSSNMCGVKDPELDKLADQLRLTFDTNERIAIARKVQAILNRLQPYTFFRATEGVFAWQNSGPPSPGTYLDGVTWSLDHLPPVYSRSRNYWHFRAQ